LGGTETIRRPRELPAWARSEPLIAIGVFGALLLFLSVVWSIPSGVLVQGMVIGGLTSLLALGLALTWRANRIINFAAADLGLVPVTFALLLVTSSLALNWWAAGAIGLLGAIVVGALVEMLLIRRFSRSPRLVLTVATIGISQLLLGLTLFLPDWIEPAASTETRLKTPFHVAVKIGPVIFGGGDVMAAVVIPLCFIALALFLRYSRIGIAIRASAERADRAASLGIPVLRVQTIVWVIAAVLAFIALWLRTSIIGLPLGPTAQLLGPAVLLRALAAGAIGRMEKLMTIALAAVGLGVLEQAVKWHWGQDAYVDPVLCVVLLAALLAVPPTGGRVRSDSVSAWQAVREVRPIPAELRTLPEVRYGRGAMGGVLFLFLTSLPMWLGERDLTVATLIVIFGIVAISLVVLTGWGGQVSLGQMGFVGVGAAVGGALTDRLGWDLGIALVVGGLAGAVIATIVGLPALRRRGLTVAVMTLAFALAMYSFFLNRSYFGEASDRDWLPAFRIDRAKIFGGISIDTPGAMYFVALGGLGVAILMVVGVRRSRTGRALIAVRENERAAESYGVHSRRTTLLAFAFSGFLAAFAGVLFVQQQNGLGTEAFRPEESLKVFSTVVIGGLGSIPGALLGSTYVRWVQFFLQGRWQLLATGGGLLLVLLVLPGGLGGALYDVRDELLRRIARRRGIEVPSLVADRRVAEPTTIIAEKSVEEHEVVAPNAVPEPAP